MVSGGVEYLPPTKKLYPINGEGNSSSRCEEAKVPISILFRGEIVSLDLTTIEHPTVIRGYLSFKTADDENIFARCEAVETAKATLEIAEKHLREMKLSVILEVFRECVSQFEQEVGQKPTVAQLSYYDKGYLLDAYDLWFRTNKEGGEVPTYSLVDGIKVVSGCHENDGEITLRLKE